MRLENAMSSNLVMACLLSIVMCEIAIRCDAQDLPKVEVSNVRRVFHNGEHCAFTDLCNFKGQYYLTFRSCPDGHGLHSSSAIIVLKSNDLRDWTEAFQFRVPQRDVRDPHFLVFKGKLFVYSGTWYCGDQVTPKTEMNLHLGYGVSSSNGTDWSGPSMLEGTFGHYVWRAAAFGEKAYLCGRRIREFSVGKNNDRSFFESVMLESDDGLVWRKRSLFQETVGNETAFLFKFSGEVLAVARRDSGPAEVCRSRPPYDLWHRTRLDRYIGGPLVATWGNEILVGGRNMINRDDPYTSLCWLAGDALVEFARLPSGGDNSYPGFVSTSERSGVVSWYSSHEHSATGKQITAIYLADINKQ